MWTCECGMTVCVHGVNTHTSVSNAAHWGPCENSAYGKIMFVCAVTSWNPGSDGYRTHEFWTRHGTGFSGSCTSGIGGSSCCTMNIVSDSTDSFGLAADAGTAPSSAYLNAHGSGTILSINPNIACGSYGGHYTLYQDQSSPQMMCRKTSGGSNSYSTKHWVYIQQGSV